MDPRPRDDRQAYLMPGTEPRNTRVNHLRRSPHRKALRLDGAWEFRLDPDDEGIEKGWHEDAVEFPDRVTVPGAIEAQELGHHHGNSMHGKAAVVTDYFGRVWYRTTVDVPENWHDRVMWLNVGGAYPNAWLWINGSFIGARYCDLTGFSYDTSDVLRPGERNSVVISMDTRDEAVRARRIDGSLLCWGGLWRSVELEATPRLSIEDVFVVPDVDAGTARLAVRIANRTAELQRVTIDVAVRTDADAGGSVAAGEANAELDVEAGGQAETTVVVDVSDVQLWHPDHPHLYDVDVSLASSGVVIDSWLDRFGMRKITAEGDRLMLNGEPLFVRGSMYQFDFPETISPPATRDAWRERVQEFKDYGFNYIRVAGSIAPPELADVADEMGILLSSTVSDIGVQVPKGTSTPDGRLGVDFLRRLWEEHVLQLRNHPSLFIWVLTNEVHLMQRPDLPEIYRLVKELDPTRPVSNCDGPGDELDTYPETDVWIPRVWPSSEQMKQLPFMLHEYVNVASLPNPATARDYDGPVKFPYIEYIAKWVQDTGLTDNYPRLLDASYGFQRECAKLAFEGLRRQPECDGYMACAQRDADGITYAGFLGRFGQRKAITSEELRQWQADTVLLSNLAGPANATYRAGEPVTARFSVSHYGPETTRSGDLRWELNCRGERVSNGSLTGLDVTPYSLTDLRHIRVVLPSSSGAEEMTLRAVLDMGGVRVENEWRIWVFPADQWVEDTDQEVVTQLDVLPHLTDRYPFLRREDGPSKSTTLLLTDHLAGNIDYLADGGRIWLLGPGELPSEPARFWPGWYTPVRNNVGVVLEDHPALNEFPHRGFAEMQLRALIGGSEDEHHLLSLDVEQDRVAKGFVETPAGHAIHYKELGVPVDPIAHGIVGFDWRFEPPTQVAYLLEAAVGEGRLLVSGFNLTGPLPEQEWLFDRLLRYCLGDDFDPTCRIPGSSAMKLLG